MDVAPDSLLLTSAEIAVAFVGFASLVGVFLARSSGELPVRVRLSLRALLDYGLLALFACGVPLLLGLAHFEERALWAISSGIFVFTWIAYVGISHYYYREIVEVAATPTGLFTWLMLAGDASSIGLLVGNALGWPFEASALVYFGAAVAWRLAGAAFSFRDVLAEAWSVPT